MRKNFKKILSFLLAVTVLTGILTLSGCKEEKNTVTLKWGIFSCSQEKTETLEKSLNSKLEELKKPYRVDIAGFSYSDYKDDYQKLSSDFDIFYLENGYVPNGNFARSPDIISCVENECFMALEDIFFKGQDEIIVNTIIEQYVIEENLDYGKIDGVQYIFPTNRSSVKKPSVVGTSFGVKTDLFEEANLPMEEYMVDITKADQLLEKLSNYSDTLIYLPTDIGLDIETHNSDIDKKIFFQMPCWDLAMWCQKTYYFISIYTPIFFPVPVWECQRKPNRGYSISFPTSTL